MTLPPIDFENLINGLDTQIVEAKKAAETKQKREELEKRYKMVHHQLEAIEARLKQMETLGLRQEPNITATVEVMRREDAALAAELEELTDPVFYAKEAPVPKAVMPEIDPAIRTKVGELLDEMRATDFMLSSMETDEKRCLFEIWANRWRILAETIGQERIQHDRQMKAAFAVLRNAIRVHSDAAHHIQALHRERQGDWSVLLSMAQKGLDTIRERHHQRKITEQQLEEVRSLLKNDVPYDENHLKHLIREIAKTKSLRDDLANVCEPIRQQLCDEGEFDFLWGDEETTPSPVKKHLTNREIVGRILSRMHSKSLIGECHGPIDKIPKGFPGADYGRAKEALELLIKSGVIRYKSQQGGRVAIESKFATACERFVAGQPLGVKIVDDWCEENP